MALSLGDFAAALNNISALTDGTISEARPDYRLPCPAGFICEGQLQANCEDIRVLFRDTFNMGDIFAGSWCPSGNSTIMNCPVGYFCEDSKTVKPCPEGYFCPYKTSQPWQQCSVCPEASDKPVRNLYGYLVMGILGSAATVYWIYHLVKSRNKEVRDRFKAARNRQLDQQRVGAIESKKRERMKKIKPKLELIAKRLKNVSGISVSEVLLIEENDFQFNAKAVFDALDNDGNGTLSFFEINQLLELNHVQLHQFVERLNEAAGEPADAKEVLRPHFVKHFLNVLMETSHFAPTSDDAEALFEEMAARGSTKTGEIDADAFYGSKMSDFLSDSQINELLKRFRQSRADSPMGDKKPETARAKRRSSTAQAPAPRRQGMRRSIAITKMGDQSKDRLTIGKAEFVEKYPGLLNEIVASQVLNRQDSGWSVASNSENYSDVLDNGPVGFDIAFEDLSLTVKFGVQEANVVNKVTGRLQAKTMTALMGGSGAGKTSLLNALCGRAFYGEVSGKIYINGHETSIDNYRDAVGFVPQDDTVYAELTVRENFVFSGLFRLPKHTSKDEIEDLTDSTMASLGLSRVANSVVGGVTRRGISGGEKKRVNIGLELMGRPAALFLDEPTSGLDSSSALLVMKSLKHLVEVQGVTVCSVIHQPRKFIYDLFDSLILLGSGGRMMYHGTTNGALMYFQDELNYALPPGESVADWLIDISSGRMEPLSDVAASKNAEEEMKKDKGRRSLAVQTDARVKTGPASSTIPTTSKLEKEQEEATLRREHLFKNWVKYYSELSAHEVQKYLPPRPHQLPEEIERASFSMQLWTQLKRLWIVAKRNVNQIFVDSAIVVLVVVAISAMQGVVEVSVDSDPQVRFYQLVETDPATVLDPDEKFFERFFSFATLANESLRTYGLMVGVIESVIVGLAATHLISNKRTEFYREAGSGYDVNAYYIAINISNTVEHTFQILMAAGAAYWLRKSGSSQLSYYSSFFMLSWLCVSWGILLAIVLPPASVTNVVGFFMAFAGLLFSGGSEPVTYELIYNNNLLALFSGFVSPTRFFIESLAVAEHRCLPAQTGFTHLPNATGFPLNRTSFAILGLAGNDINVTHYSCEGWYWGIVPALMVGITVRFAAGGAIHVSGRLKQSKQSFWTDVSNEFKNREGFQTTKTVVIYSVVLILLFSFTSWLLLRVRPEDPL